MFQRAFLLNLRQLLQQKGYSLVHIFGIAIGFASCCIMLLYINREYSYDRFFDRSEAIYKMVEINESGNQRDVKATVPYSYARILEEQYPEVEVATAISGPYGNQNISLTLDKGEKRHFLEEAAFLADSNFFEVFSWKILAGDRHKALIRPNSVVLTEKTAKKYFGDLNPLGRTIHIGHRASTVTAICESPPSHSHFAFNYLVSASTVAWFSQEDFNLKTTHCYLKLNQASEAAPLADKFPALVEQYFLPAIEKLRQTAGASYAKDLPDPQYQLKPLHDIHLDPDKVGKMKPTGNQRLLQILQLIALFILLMAGINFINLSTVQSTQRDREIAVSKIVGADKQHLLVQFLMRSTLLAIVGVSFGLLIVHFSLPFFNGFMETDLTLGRSVVELLFYLLAALGVGMLAGIYPALKISAIAPLALYKPAMSKRPSDKRKRNVLVVFQFTIAMVLLIGTLVIQQQRQLLASKDLGYDQEQVLVLKGTFERDPSRAKAFLNSLNEVASVSDAAGSLWVQGMNSSLRKEEYQIQKNTPAHALNRISVGDRFTSLLDIEIVKGEGFSSLAQDSTSVLLNESAVHLLGLADPVGKRLTRIDEDHRESFLIKGVVKDFHFESLVQDIEPLVIQSNEYYQGRMAFMLLKLAPGHPDHSLKQIEERWKKFMEGKPFSYRFLDDSLQAQYDKEKRLGTVFSLYTGLSLLICLMGLFSLAAYNMQLREKEIGIRKIVGASVGSLLHLLSKEYSKLVFWSFLIAIPLSIWIAEEWLQHFALRINLRWSLFASCGLAVLLLSYTCVAYQMIRLTRKSPVETLKGNS